jgi:hypothetical protein
MDRMNRMSRKDYEMIAKCIRDAGKQTLGSIFRDLLISSLCAEFAKDNPRFDADRFREACNLVENQA